MQLTPPPRDPGVAFNPLRANGTETWDPANLFCIKECLKWTCIAGEPWTLSRVEREPQRAFSLPTFIWDRKFVGLERSSASLRSEFLIASSIIMTCARPGVHDKSNGNTITRGFKCDDFFDRQALAGEKKTGGLFIKPATGAPLSNATRKWLPFEASRTN